MENYELVIIGGGSAGLAAAESARKQGIEDILILERDERLGGILNQCIHSGFGLHMFKEELTGPEYASRYIEKIQALKIDYKLNTMVLNITKDKQVTFVNEEGVRVVNAEAIVLAAGCRERPRSAINIQGTRPAGIFSAGAAQKFVNIHGVMPGKKAVILGSGDIGLIMARRMTLEGAKVEAVVEIMPYSSGLKRNIVQCLDDFDIPLLLSHTVVSVHGKERVSGVTIAQVEKDLSVIEGTERFIDCDALLLSVGLLPENELSALAGVELSTITGGPIVNESFQTSVEGIFVCGNMLHVHDLVDYVSMEAEKAGASAAKFIKGKRFNNSNIKISGGNGVRYTVPSYIDIDNIESEVDISFRVDKEYIKSKVIVSLDGEFAIEKKERIMTPGEMGTLRMKKDILLGKIDLKEITLGIE